MIEQEEEQPLGEPITLIQLRDALAGLKKGKKSLGWNRSLGEFYPKFSEELGQSVLSTFIKSLRKAFYSDMNAALIT